MAPEAIKAAPPPPIPVYQVEQPPPPAMPSAPEPVMASAPAPPMPPALLPSPTPTLEIKRAEKKPAKKSKKTKKFEKMEEAPTFASAPSSALVEALTPIQSQYPSGQATSGTPTVLPIPTPELGSGYKNITITQPITPNFKPDIGKALDEELKKYLPGSVAYEVPEEMYYKKVEKVKLIISRQKLEEKLKTLFKDRLHNVKFVHMTSIPHAGTSMSAQLSGTGFNIFPEGFIEKTVTFDDDTLWSWNVVPKYRNSELPLQLEIKLNLTDLTGNKINKSVPVFEKTIKIRITQDWFLDWYKDNKDLINWIFGSSGVGGLLAWVYNRWKKKS